jgi:hypothetical protein
MFEMLNALPRSIVPLRKAARAGLLSLLFVLCAGWVSPAAPARAAQPAEPGTPTKSRFYLNIVQPGTLCAGQVYPIIVTPQVEVELEDPDEPHRTAIFTVAEAVQIKSEVSDTSIATIDPPSETATGIGPFQKDDAPATFNLHTKKAGTTFLYLTAEVPARYSGGVKRYFGPNVGVTGYPINVVNCAYKVTATYTWRFAVQGARISNSGTLEAKITATDPEYYGGDGSFKFVLVNADLNCFKVTAHQLPTHVSGHRNFTTDQLELTFQSGAPAGTVTETCPNSFLVSHAALYDPSGPWKGTPRSFPLTGGTQTFRLDAVEAAGGLPPAKVTITLEPVTAKGTP